MSVYAFDPDSRQLVVVWPSTVGSRAHVVVQVDDDAEGLCEALSRLSEALWDTYVRPASATDDEQEHRRREHERQRFDSVVAAIGKPNLPDESGMMIGSYSPVEESAHQVGRVLHRLAATALSEAVVADIQVELDAVSRAELGDLSGRAVQAVALDRLDASPIQVAAADELLRADPLGGGLLSAAVDPAAGCVAAAHWLAAAAEVAADAAGTTPSDVFTEADGIQAVSVAVPSTVVAHILDGTAPPRQVVLALLRAAVAAGEGEIADLPGVLAQRARFEELLQRLPADQRDETLAAEPVRATLLDPRRPARDLLEHLLDGIASCHLLYAEYADDAVEDDDNADFGENDDDVAADVQQRADIAEEFADLVRAQAALTRDRLS